MKNSLLTFILLTLLMACSNAPIKNTSVQIDKQVSVNTKKIYNDKSYLALQARAQVDDVTLNYGELRQAFTQSSYYEPYGSKERTRVESIFKLFAEDKYTECLESSEKLLTTNFISLGAHYVSVICAKALNLDKKAYLHEGILEGLLDSISKSGDGKDISSAYVVYTTEELYTFLQLNGLNVKGQDIINENSKVFESMQLSANNSNEEFTLFFDITTQWQHAFSGLQESN